jgi:hypothetical protein
MRHIQDSRLQVDLEAYEESQMMFSTSSCASEFLEQSSLHMQQLWKENSLFGCRDFQNQTTTKIVNDNKNSSSIFSRGFQKKQPSIKLWRPGLRCATEYDAEQGSVTFARRKCHTFLSYRGLQSTSVSSTSSMEPQAFQLLYLVQFRQNFMFLVEPAKRTIESV